MGESWRIGVDEREQTELVTTGPFAVVRNPIFAAMIPASVGLSLMVPSWVAFVGVFALVLAVEMQVGLVGESYLRRIHGAFDRYAAQVGRLAPRPHSGTAETTQAMLWQRAKNIGVSDGAT